MCKRIRGKKIFSYDLDQGGMELSADFRFMSSYPKLLEQMQEKMTAAIKTYQALRQEQGGTKKDNKTNK